MSFELKPKNLSKSKKEKAKILIAQPSWKPSQIKNRDVNQLIQLEFTKENEEFLDAVLAKGKDKTVDLIVFPELAIPEQCHDKIKTWTCSNEVIVVAGSTYLEREKKFFNTASVFFEGIQHKTEKHDLSPLEVSRISGHGPSAGADHVYFQNTPVGNLAVMICADEFDRNTRDEFLNKDLDILCVIACQSEGKEHHQSIDRIVKEYQKGIYVVYCNALCDSLSDGRSAFFANDYKETFAESRETGLTQNNGIDRRIIEMPSVAGCLIVECNLQKKLVTFPNKDSGRSLVKLESPFVFENGNLRQLTLEESKATIAKHSKEETAYQPSALSTAGVWPAKNEQQSSMFLISQIRTDPSSSYETYIKIISISSLPVNVKVEIFTTDGTELSYEPPYSPIRAGTPLTMVGGELQNFVASKGKIVGRMFAIKINLDASEQSVDIIAECVSASGSKSLAVKTIR